MDGILVVDKPQGITSHDVVDLVRKSFGLKKVGHAGTLDPQAQGVLVVLIGKYTKKSKELAGHNKEYEACLTLGVATDSLDGEGRIIKKEEVNNFSLERVQQIFSQFLGRIEQIPPMFSALKFRGKRLYALARRGIEVKRTSREVFIYKLKITKFTPPCIYFVVACSKGTYIRTLCADIAQKLGSVGYLSHLCRISSGPFTLEHAVSLERLKNFSHQELRQTLLY